MAAGVRIVGGRGAAIVTDRVLIVAHRGIFAEALTESLTRAGIATRHVEVEDTEAVAGTFGPTAALLDTDSLAGRFGACVAALRARAPGSRLVAIVGSAGRRAGRAPVDKGVTFVTADVTVEQLLGVLRGGAVPASRDRLRSSGRADHEWSALDQLTERERQVLLHLSAGLHGRGIAEAMGISSNTVRTHVQNLLGKLGVSSRFEAVSLGRRAGLLAEPPTR